MCSMELQPITQKDRSMGGLDYFLLWFGASISIAEIYVGNIMAPLGWAVGLAAIFIGHVIGTLPLALGGNLGSDTGLPTMYVLRPTFGRVGSYLATILNILQLIGWTAIMLILGGIAVKSLLPENFFITVTIWIVIMGIVCTIWALVGKATFKWLQRIAVTALGVLCVIMTVVLWVNYKKSGFVTPPDGGITFGVGLDLAVALPISWLPLVADYSRFAKSTKGSFWGTYIGYFVGSCWMFALGIASTLVLQKPDPITTMAVLGLGVPALIIVLFSTFTSTFLDIYSTAVSALNLRTTSREWWFILPAGIIGIIVAVMIPLTDYHRYEGFLILIGSFFMPLFGVTLTHYFLMDYGKRKVRSIEWIAIISWAAGVVIFQIASRKFYLGGSLPSFVLSGCIYYALRKLMPDSDKT